MPTITDVLWARRTLKPHLIETPLLSCPALNEVSGAMIELKLEGCQPTGAFKVRGGLTLLAGMSAQEREQGLVTYSTGNHAQSMAYAARHFNVPCVVVMPEAANPAKVRAVRALGTTVLTHGRTLEDSRDHAHAIAGTRRLINPGNQPELIAGVATAAWEIFEAAPNLDALVVPVGSGTGVAAAGLVASALAPGCEVIGVQSTSATAAHDSWRAGHVVCRPNLTLADGLATGVGFDLPQAMMRRYLADFLLVTDEQIAAAQSRLLSLARTMTEMAGAASLAAVLAHRSRFAGKRVGVLCSGANPSAQEVAAVAAGVSEQGGHGGFEIRDLEPDAAQTAEDDLCAARR